MTLLEALHSCKEGNFVSHSTFDPSQSMHYYKGSFYYEDGSNLDGHLYWMLTEKWAKDGWYLKYPALQINQDLLDFLHTSLYNNKSYETCIIRS